MQLIISSEAIWNKFKIDAFKYSWSWVTYFIFANGTRLKWHDDKESQLFNYVSPFILSLPSNILSLHWQRLWHNWWKQPPPAGIHQLHSLCLCLGMGRLCHRDLRVWLSPANTALFQSCQGFSRDTIILILILFLFLLLTGPETKN